MLDDSSSYDTTILRLIGILNVLFPDSLISFLFGFYLNCCQDSDDGDLLQGYIAHYIDDDENAYLVAFKNGQAGILKNKKYILDIKRIHSAVII